MPSDFATWVARRAQDRVLGERLGVVEPFDFDDTEALRAEMVGPIRDDLDHASSPCRPEFPNLSNSFVRTSSKWTCTSEWPLISNFVTLNSWPRLGGEPSNMRGIG